MVLKIVKCLLITLCASFIFASLNTKAAFRTYSSIKIPGFSGIYSDGPLVKTTNSNQEVHTINARDGITGGERAISVRTIGTNAQSGWISAPIGSIVTWPKKQNGGNSSPGAYNINIKATRSTAAITYYWGTWDLK